MIDMILANRACDLAYYYGWGSNAFSQLGSCLLPSSSSGGVAAQNKKYKASIERNIEQLLRSMARHDA